MGPLCVCLFRSLPRSPAPPSRRRTREGKKAHFFPPPLDLETPPPKKNPFFHNNAGRAYVHFNQDGVSSPKDAVTVSEAVGFGMLAAVLAGPKYDFDAFLKMYESFSNARSGMMGWEIVERGGVLKFNDDLNANGNDSATDGDMDAAVALILAGERFSDPTYTAKGRAVGVRLQQWTLNPESGLPNLGDWVARSPGVAQDRGYGPKFFYYVSRPSDFSQAAMFSILEKGGAGDPLKWRRAREQGLTALETLLNESPLPPDFAVWDPAAKRIVRPQSGVTLLEKYTDSDFSWNACRVPWRLAARLVEDPSDQRARALAQRLASFYQSRTKLNAGYRLPTLEPLVDFEAVAFSAPAWALLKALGDPKASQYEADVRRLRSYGGLAKSYYGDSTLLLAGLQLSKPFWRK
jgi:endoglucanase